MTKPSIILGKLWLLCLLCVSCSVALLPEKTIKQKRIKSIESITYNATRDTIQAKALVNFYYDVQGNLSKEEITNIFPRQECDEIKYIVDYRHERSKDDLYYHYTHISEQNCKTIDTLYFQAEFREEGMFSKHLIDGQSLHLEYWLYAPIQYSDYVKRRKRIEQKCMYEFEFTPSNICPSYDIVHTDKIDTLESRIAFLNNTYTGYLLSSIRYYKEGKLFSQQTGRFSQPQYYCAVFEPSDMTDEGLIDAMETADRIAKQRPIPELNTFKMIDIIEYQYDDNGNVIKELESIREDPYAAEHSRLLTTLKYLHKYEVNAEGEWTRRLTYNTDDSIIAITERKIKYQ